MGFFDGLKRLAQGKSVFEVPPAGSPDSEQQGEVYHHYQPTPLGVAGEHHEPTPLGPKELPMVTIDSAFSTHDNPHLECELRIRNHSHQTVRLERLDFLGNHYELNKQYLQPDQTWEYQLRADHRPTSTGYHEATLFFESQTGDDFCTVHNVEFTQLADRTYDVAKFRFLPPVRDI